MKVEYLELEDVIELHDQALKDFGGIQGREPGKLEAKLALPMSGYGDFERYPSIEEKASVYLYEMASGHCFSDGNKRTSFLSTFTFLDLNGFDLVVEDEEVYRFVLSVANDKTRPPFEEVVLWIRKHTHKRFDIHANKE
ncbi:hypothetical protein AOX59_16480 [Lentibacillus amyloliquefaciens]|uniref:Fido domain-containing protein n=1 Tax=Lentibacillus amyloliquefaciens TaxID=1472767 RepID=A0A0U4FB54_9BACI|nr:hypothetical protein AOX59_16480 [Lentibacillus amyloliquefaciens]